MRCPTSPSSVAENSIVWCAPGAVPQDPLDLRREPVVGHAVGLVEAHDLDRTEIDLASTSAGRSVAAAWRRPARRRVRGRRSGCAGWRRRTPGSTRMPAWRAIGSSTSATCTASSRVGTSTSPSGLRGSAVVGDAGQHRHAEGERLAGTGLGPAAHVAALHRHRDGLGLDRERLGESLRRQPVVDPGRHAEGGEAGRWLDRRQGIDRGQVARAVGLGTARDRHRQRSLVDGHCAGCPAGGRAAVLWHRSWFAQGTGAGALELRDRLRAVERLAQVCREALRSRAVRVGT